MRTLLLATWVCALSMALVPACGDDSGPNSAGPPDDAAGAAGEAGTGATAPMSTGGEAGGGSLPGGDGGNPAASGGQPAASGGSTAGTVSGGTMSSGGSGSNALCQQADGDGFFATCDACGPDCDTIDTNAGSRKACGCGAGCPCGFSCGCYEIGPGISVCDLCLR